MRDYSRNYNISLLDHKKAPNPYWKIIISIFLSVIVLVVLFYNRKQNKNITSNNANLNPANSISRTALIDSIEKVISQNTGTYSVYIYDIKIEYLIKHPEYTERYRTLARERIKKYYNWDDVIGKTEELMKKLLGL